LFVTVNAIDKGKYSRPFVNLLKKECLQATGKMAVQTRLEYFKSRTKSFIRAYTPNFLRKIIKHKNKDNFFTKD